VPLCLWLVLLSKTKNAKRRTFQRFSVSAFQRLSYGTVFTAGSLHTPDALFAPMPRTRTHTLLPLVNPSNVTLDLFDTVLNTLNVLRRA
jgi:hypothetical protein